MKKLVTFFSFLFLAISSWGIYSENFPIVMTQPDGTILQCYITGDEFYNWLHDAEGYTIVQDPETGYLVYARLENDALVATEFVVGRTDPQEAGLVPGLNISADKRNKLRKEFLEVVSAKHSKNKKKSSERAANEGTLNNVVVYIRFADQEEFGKDTTHYWKMFNSMEHQNTPSMRNYFKQMSYDKIDIVSHFFPVGDNNYILSYQDIYERSYYMPYNAVTNPEGYNVDDIYDRLEREQGMLIRAIESINDQIPWSLDLDFNDDMAVDNICFIIRGEPTAWNTLLWPHKWTFFYDVELNYYYVEEYNLLIESHLDTYQSSVISHETFHTLGAPDLYRYSDNSITPVGRWDVMASNTNPPQSTSAYMKYKYGKWIKDIPKINAGGTYTLYPVWAESKNGYHIVSPNSTSEHFMVEFRDRNVYWDQNLYGSGLIISRINTKYSGNAQGPPDEIYVYRPGGTLHNDGTIAEAHFSADVGRTEFNDQTNPSCFLSDGKAGGISIRNISTVGDSMTFDILFKQKPKIVDFKANPWHVELGGATEFTDLSSDFPTSWEWEFEGGIPEVSNEKNPHVRYETEGLYSVKLTVANEYGESSLTKKEYIAVGMPTPIVEFEADNETDILVNGTVSFTDFSQRNPTSWEWHFEGGSPETTTYQHPKRIYYRQPGTFSVSLTATNQFGSETKTIKDYIKVSTVGIETTEGAAITATVYPNPSVSGHFTLTTHHIPVGAMVEVFDMTGRQIAIKELKDTLMNIDLSGQPAGTYFLKITDNQSVYQLKLVKQ